MENDPDYAGLTHEAGNAASEQELVQWEQESNLADHILCASAFTRRSLELSGVPAHKISVVPYGIDTKSFVRAPPATSR